MFTEALKEVAGILATAYCTSANYPKSRRLTPVRCERGPTRAVTDTRRRFPNCRFVAPRGRFETRFTAHSQIGEAATFRTQVSVVLDSDKIHPNQLLTADGQHAVRGEMHI